MVETTRELPEKSLVLRRCLDCPLLPVKGRVGKCRHFENCCARLGRGTAKRLKKE